MVVLKDNGMVAQWQIEKLLKTPCSGSAGMNSEATAATLGLGILLLAEKLLMAQVSVTPLHAHTERSNALTSQATPWRSRHHALKASWIIDIDVTHASGQSILADGLAKVLPNIKLEESTVSFSLHIH